MDRTVPPSEDGPGASGKPGRGRRPVLVSVALIAALAASFGLGYRAGVPAATTDPDIRPGSVSSRLQQAFLASAPGGWAVCDLGGVVSCRRLAISTTDTRVPPSEYTLGWYGLRNLTQVTARPGHMGLVAVTGEGAITAWLDRVEQGDVVEREKDLTPVTPDRGGTFYFDLGTLTTAHYVVEADYMAVPPAEAAGQVRTYIVGFVVS